MNGCEILILCMGCGLVLMFVLLILMYYESEKEKKNLIKYYENQLKTKSNRKSNGGNLDSLFKKK